MDYIYWNQRNYPDIPYPSSAHPDATILSGGCGISCGAIIISNMTNTQVDPPYMSNYAQNCNARVAEGTDMTILATNMCKDFGLSFTSTADINELYNHLKSGNMAVINVSGDRAGWTGVFSSAGHFVVGATVIDDGRFGILDPAYYTGKFDIAGRAGKVEMDGNLCLCDVDVIQQDTVNRDPAYWLFKGGINMEQWKIDAVQNALNEKIITQNHDPSEAIDMGTLCAMLCNLKISIINEIKGVS